MQQPCSITDITLKRWIAEAYGLTVNQVQYVPQGDSAYSYVITDNGGTRYFFKIYDRNTRRGQDTAARAEFYLAITKALHDQGLFQQLSVPLWTQTGLLQVAVDNCIFALFTFVDGSSLAEAHPFPTTLNAKLGIQLGMLHGCSHQLRVDHRLEEAASIAFLDTLQRLLAELQWLATEDPILYQARQALLPQLPAAERMMERVRQLRHAVVADRRAKVLCHGDVWGGNLILGGDSRIYFVDWESAVFAAPEYDLLNFISEDPEPFLVNYQRALGQPLLLKTEVYGFYQHRRHLRNLYHWLWSLLREETTAEQRRNDLDMIIHHCLDRWADIEPSMARLAAALDRLQR